eukprot:c18255_g1_i3.p1 GENE.c18255_g1_i3~~c18255_g1_i3.p1  ORF type:complete len:384 (+),score=69.43 c18255_g1_i3:134-1153(+)
MSKEDVSKKTDEQLFVVDKAKDVESYKQVRNARPLEMPDSAKELFWQSALVPKDGLPPLSKVTKVPHGAHRGDRLALERAKQRLENSQTEPKRSRKRQRVDIWDIEQPKITPNESILAPKVIPKRKKTAGLKPVVEDMPAVRVPSEGLSYNPRDEAHQEALAVAAAQLRKRDLEYEDAIEKMNPKGVTGEGLIVSVGGPDDSADEQDDDAQKLVKRARLSQDRLSTAQRNRRERHRVLMRMIQQQKRDKMILKQLDQLPNISREVKTFEEQAQTKMERRAALLRERRRRTPFVGKLRVSDYTEVLEVPRTAELSGSLRTMKVKPEHSLFCSTLIFCCLF